MFNEEEREFFEALLWDYSMSENGEECADNIEIEGSDMNGIFGFVRFYKITEAICESFVEENPNYNNHYSQLKNQFKNDKALFIAIKEKVDFWGCPDQTLVAKSESLKEVQGIAEAYASCPIF